MVGLSKNRKIYELTQEGLNNLKQELKILKEEKRPDAIQLLQEAKALGDLSENADYDAARDLQAKVESRIKEVETIIDNAQIVKVAKTNNQAAFGKTIKLLFIEKNKEVKYKLVGTVETDPNSHKISVDSPIGKAVMGRERGEVVLVQLQNGKSFNVEILEITNEQ